MEPARIACSVGRCRAGKTVPVTVGNADRRILSVCVFVAGATSRVQQKPGGLVMDNRCRPSHKQMRRAGLQPCGFARVSAVAPCKSPRRMCTHAANTQPSAGNHPWPSNNVPHNMSTGPEQNRCKSSSVCIRLTPPNRRIRHFALRVYSGISLFSPEIRQHEAPSGPCCENLHPSMA